MAIKLREFRVLDRSVKMIVLFVLGFFLFLGVFAVRGHEERGYIHNDEREVLFGYICSRMSETFL